MFPPRDFMPMPTNSMGMNMPVYAMGPQILPPGNAFLFIHYY